MKPHSIDSAPNDAKPILEAVEKKFGFIPNLMGIFANNTEALKSYLALNDALEQSGLNPTEQQIVALTVSRVNGCEYCMAAHSAIAAMGGIDKSIVDGLRDGATLEHPKHDALRNFTEQVTSKRGWLDKGELDKFKDAGYTDSHVLAVIIGVTMKTLSNYTNHIGETPLDDNFKEFAWSAPK